MRQGYLILLVFAVAPLQSALAAGYGLDEESAEAMGTAFAGAAATGSDASYLSYNPATAAAGANGDVSLSAISITPKTAATYGTTLTAAGTPTGGNGDPHAFVRN